MSFLGALLICLAPVAYDGDTVKCGTGPTRIRLFAVSAPEKGQPGDPASTANLNRLVAGGLICDPPGASYNRIVGVCRNAAGVDVGKAQIEAGHATEWCAYSVSKAHPNGFYGGCTP